MQSIEIKPNTFVTVDDEDATFVLTHQWYITPWGYPTNDRIGYLHKVIIGARDSQIVDHINRNVLDCRKENLRVVTKQQNARNTGIRTDNTSGAKNVRFHNQNKCWTVQFTFHGTQIYIGSYYDKDLAILIATAAAKHMDSLLNSSPPPSLADVKRAFHKE